MSESESSAEDQELESTGVLSRRRRIWRGLRLGAIVAALFLLITVLTSLTVDLGPVILAKAEAAGTNYLNRELRIGKLSLRILKGDFVVEDLYVAGLTPTDRPFLEADRIVVSMAWAPLLRREIFVESFEMDGWRMLIETFEGRRHTMPTFGSTEPSESGEKLFVTTFQRIQAKNGELTFEDHASPWSVIARNLDINVVKAQDYRGEVNFSGGTIQIQEYEPMNASLQASFEIEGPYFRFERIALLTDGAETVLTGDLDMRKWPEQTYELRSEMDFSKMREIFWARDHFRLSGIGEFIGTYRLYTEGHDVSGTFTSELAGFNEHRFPNLAGSLRWLRDSFELWDTTSEFNGGRAYFTHSMAPLDQPDPAIATFDFSYEDIDLTSFTETMQLDGLRLAGRAKGHYQVEWPLEYFTEHRGSGHVTFQPPEGLSLQTRMSLSTVSQVRPELETTDESVATQPLGPLGIGGHVTYRFDDNWITVEPSQLATARTYVSFEGRTAYGNRSRMPFHVTSSDWQESDKVLAAIMTAFGSPTTAVQVGGVGEIDGVLVDSFARPKIIGTFKGDRMRAWDVEWGAVQGQVVIDEAYANISESVVTDRDSEIHIEGRFSLGYPREDGRDEIDARINVIRRPLVDFRHAFELDDYPITGVVYGQYHLLEKYEEPFGFGSMTIRDAVAYGEPIETAAMDLEFEGSGVRLTGIEMRKSTGLMTGAAQVIWEGSYTFNADATKIPMESVVTANYADTPLSGILEFSASGAGLFDAPNYDVRGRINDLVLRDEAIGQVSGRIGVRADTVNLEIEAASPRLAISGSGRIARTAAAHAELTFRVVNTSLDPYIRTFEPGLSPFTSANASGVVRIVGELQNPDRLKAEVTIEQLDLKFFDYVVRNDGSIRLGLDRNVIRAEHFRLTGRNTQLELTGEVDLESGQLSGTAAGDVNLSVLQGFFREIRSSGEVAVKTDIGGSLEEPIFIGQATVTNGRLRHFSLPHAFEAVNGKLSFNAGGIHLDDVTARIGGGKVLLGGRIGLDGYVVGELDITATGERMRVRFPEGVRSVVDANLALRGNASDPVLTGEVNVRSAVWGQTFNSSSDLFEFPESSVEDPADSVESLVPLRLDIQILAPQTLRIENNNARVISSADLNLRGTFDRPLLFGRADIVRGEVLFEGNRYFVTRGSVDFANPVEIEPFFDIEAETRVRVPGETYRVLVHVTGTADRFIPNLTSDPPLPTVDILALLFGDPRDPRDAELRALRSPESAEQELVRARAARLLASPISESFGRVVERTFGVDSVQITPSLSGPTAQQSARLSPAARLTIGKRISDRVFLTFSRALTASSSDEIILLEYDQTDRLAWLMSRNEDRTYAIDFRVRHRF